MEQQELEGLLKDFQALPKECEWVEFKINNTNPQDIGEYLSALSNSACYHKKPFGYLVFGLEDVTHRLVGTDFAPLRAKKGGQELENWLATQLDPRIDFNIFEFDYQQLHFVIFRVQATRHTPVSFRGKSFIRIGSYKKMLDDHPEKERLIWNNAIPSVFERNTVQNAISEDEVLKLIDYPGFFELLKIPLPDNKSGVIERLLQEKAITVEKGHYQATNLGAVLFAKDLNVFDGIARKAMGIIIYEGNNRIITKKGKRSIGEVML